MMSRSLAVSAALLVPFAGATRASITPVEKVLNMLSEMEAKGKKMMEQEAKTAAAYDEWVDDQSKQLGFAVSTGESNIEELLAAIGQHESNVKKLADAIVKLEKNIDTAEQELSAASKVRDGENAEFLTQQQDYEETIDALNRAIATMSKANVDQPQAAAMLQEMAKSSQAMMTVYTAYQEHSASESGAPAAAAYQGQGGGVIEMMQGLLKKFEDELSGLVAAETSQSNSFEMVKQHLTTVITRANADRDEKASVKASTQAAAEKAKKDLQRARNTLAADKKTLADMIAEHKAKSATIAANQKVRKDELEAIGKAIEIMSSGDVAGGYKKNINLAQSPSLLQRVSEHSSNNAVSFLTGRANALSSRELYALVARMLDTPFAKVINMIEELLAKLKQQAQEEAEHKAWCDEELKNNKLKREKKTASVERLTADIEGMDGQIATMAAEIAELLKGQEELTKAMAAATKQRQAEKADNLETIADAAAGSKAVKAALVVLREFYDKQAALLQSAQAPEVEAYGGMSVAKGGVVGMMEVIASDFARLEADTTASEKQAAAEYDTFMSDSTADKKAKHEAEVKTKLEKDQTEFERGQTNKDLAAVSAELGEANDYHETLKPQCVQVPVSYEERVEKRKQEIKSLQDAYDMLAVKQ